MLRLSLIPTLCVSLCAIAPLRGAEGEVMRLSLRDALKAALENNLSIEIQRTSWQGTMEAGTLYEESAFEWMLGATGRGSWSKSGSLSTTLLPAGDAELEALTYSNSRSVTATLQKPFVWGGAFQFDYSPYYSGWGSDSTATLLDPPYTVFPRTHSNNLRPYGGSWGFSYSQSLLKGFGRKVTEGQLVIARRGLEAADANFRKSIMDHVAQIEAVYWNLVNAQMNMANKQQALDIARRQLRENEIRVETGVLAPIEVTSSEANVAIQELAIIQAEAALLNAKDTFVRTVYSTARRPDGIELTDVPGVADQWVSEEAAIKVALESRAELVTGRLDLENARLNEEIAQANRKPTLNASVGYNGSALSAGAFGPVNGDLFGLRYPGYAINLTFSMPILNKAARYADIKARAGRRGAELALKDTELAIILDVRTAYRNVQAAEKSITASEKSRILAQATYDAEQMRFANGLSTNFVVLQRQNDLDNAKTAELDANISYMNARTALLQAMGVLLESRDIRVQ